MKIINQPAMYPLNPYKLSKFEFDQRVFNRMKYRAKIGNFDKWKRDFDNWEYKFSKNDLHIIRKEIGVTFVIIHFEKENKSIVARSAWIVPQMDSFIQFNMRADIPFEEKMQIFLNETFQLLQKKIETSHTMITPKNYHRIEVKIHLEYSFANFGILKDEIQGNKYDSYHWGYELNKNNWFCLYHIGAGGFLIKAQLTRHKNKMVIERVFIYPKINEYLLGVYTTKKSLSKVAEGMIAGHIAEILLGYYNRTKSPLEKILEALNNLAKVLQILSDNRYHLVDELVVTYHANFQKINDSVSLQILNNNQYMKLKELYMIFDNMINKNYEYISKADDETNSPVWDDVSKKAKKALSLLENRI